MTVAFICDAARTPIGRYGGSGMSGTPLALTATTEPHRRSGRHALCIMCIGVGQGIALILESV